MIPYTTEFVGQTLRHLQEALTRAEAAEATGRAAVRALYAEWFKWHQLFCNAKPHAACPRPAVLATDTAKVWLASEVQDGS